MKITKIINISFKEISLSKRRRLLISLGILASVAVAAVLILFFGGKDTLAAWFDQSWAFRRRILVTNNATAETNVYITIANVDTSDTAKFQADCGDIRFTKESGQLLDYYIVSGCGTATTTLHVQFDTLIAGLQDIYMYYGNPSVANGFTGSDFSTQASNYSVGSLAAEEKSPAPVAHWKFDEGYGTQTKDATQNGQNFSFTASPAWQTEDMCISGKCIKLPADSDYLSYTVSSTSPINLGTSDFTISHWQKVFQPTTFGSGIIGRYPHNTSYNGNFSTGILDNTTTYFLYHRDMSGAIQGFTIDYSAYFGKWVQIEWVRSGSTMYLYIDGKLKQQWTITITPNISFSGSPFYVGNTGWSPGTMSNLMVDDFKIYNYARTTAQIKADYASRGSTKGAAVLLGDSSDKWLSDGLVGYWKMDESSWNGTSGEVKDASGNATNGTASCNSSQSPGCSVPTTGSGKFGNAGSFATASSQGVNFGDAAILEVDGTNSYSGFAWIKPASTGKREIFHKRTGTCSEGYNFYTNSTGTIELNSAENSVNYTTTSTATAPVGSWTFVGFTIDRVTKKQTIYVNGAANGTATDITNMSDMTNICSFEIANWGPLGDLFFDGSIDDVRIYNRALSPNEVLDLYNWASGPTAYWTFDEKTGTNLYDRSGNGNNSTAFTGSPAWVSGKYGGALDFNGTTGNVTVPVFNPKNITVEGWFYRDALDATNADAIFGGWYWVSDGQLRQGYDLRFYINQSTLNWIVETTNGSTVSEVVVSSSALNTGQWYHAAGTYDSASGKSYLYINGTLSGSATGTAGNTIVPQTQYADMRIGYSRVNNGYFDGKVDDLRIYNYARAAKQIVEDMNAGHPTVGSPVGSAVGYWKFDEGYGVTAYNLGNGGSAINGTLLGTTLPTWSNSGKFGKVLSYNGSTAYLETANSSSLDPTTGLTISAWINVNSLANSTNYNIFAKQNWASKLGYRLALGGNGSCLNNNCLFIGVGDGVNQTETTSSNINLTDTGTWHHVVGTFSPGTLTLYVDGKQRYTTTTAVTSISGSGTVARIARHSSGNEYFPGLIDEVKIYNFALTEDEVKLDYNHGAALVMGATSTDSSGNPDNSSAREYCIPGDTTSCSAPVAEWKMDEKTGQSINDSSDNNTVGTLGSSGGTDTNDPTWTSAKFGGGLNFDGSNDYVDLGITPSALSFITGRPNVSFTAWIKPDVINDYDGVICNSIDGSATGQRFCLTLQTTNRLRFLVGNSTSFLSFYSAINSLVPNQWQHITVTMDSSNNVRLYVNGQLSGGTQTLTVDLETSPVSWKIGAAFNGPTSYQFDGVMDNLKIYNYALTPAQIAWDYNRGGPVGHWKFDECQGGTANDSSGNGYTGTITIGATGSNTALGTCAGSAGEAWKDGAVGKFNSSLEFDGTDDRVSIPTSVSLPKITVSAWIKTSTSTEQYITERSNTSYYFATGIAAGKVCFYLAGASANWLCSSNRVDDGNWHHVAGTYDGTNKIVYVDGKNVASIAGSGDISSGGSNAINIGVRNNAGSYVNYFNGQIDDVKIYNYGMTPTQIKTLSNDGAVRYGPATGSP